MLNLPLISIFGLSRLNAVLGFQTKRAAVSQKCTASALAHSSALPTPSGNEYEVLCGELGRNRNLCATAKLLIFLATTFAPSGSLTTRDAIAIASLLLTMTTIFVRSLRPALLNRLVHLRLIWSTRTGLARGVDRVISRSPRNLSDACQNTCRRTRCHGGSSD